MAEIVTKQEPIVFRDDEERDVWTQATVAFASAAWSNGRSSFRITAAEMADRLIRERRTRERRDAPMPGRTSTIRRAASLIRDDRGECQTATELDAIADEMEAARRSA